MHTEDFRHRLFFREWQKLWHREAFTQRIFYTHKLFHRSFYTEKLLSTSFYTQTSLQTEARTHRRLLCTEAFTQRSLYTQTLSHRKNDSTEQLLHTSKSQFYVFDVRPSYRAKGLHPALENRNFWRCTMILREMGCAWPCKIAFLYQFFFAWNGCASRSKMDKVAILHQFLNGCIWRLKSQFSQQLLPFDFHATLASELSKYTSFWWLTLISCEGAAPGPAKFAFCHVFGCPTCAISVSTDGCCGPKDKQDPHFATRLGVRHAAEGNVS